MPQDHGDKLQSKNFTVIIDEMSHISAEQWKGLEIALLSRQLTKEPAMTVKQMENMPAYHGSLAEQLLPVVSWLMFLSSYYLAFKLMFP